MMKKELLGIISLALIFGFLLAGCSRVSAEEDSEPVPAESVLSGQSDTVNMQQAPEGENGEVEAMLQMKIGEALTEVEWENNGSVEALKELCRETPLTIQMSMYGGFEQVGSIGQSLPREDSQTTTQAGDIVLYSGNQIVVFYGSNSWAYTRLGHITDKSAADLEELLGNGDVTITLSIA